MNSALIAASVNNWPEAVFYSITVVCVAVVACAFFWLMSRWG